MKIRKTVYHIWEACRHLERTECMLGVGKWHYHLSSKKGEISMVRFMNYLIKGNNFWEIYSAKGDLFCDVERYKTKEKALARCEELL